MTKVDVVDADVLLSDFLRRVANDKHADDQIVQKSVMNIVGGLAQNTKLQHALVTYQKCGLIGQDSYQSLMVLCNSILDELQDEGWKGKLNTHLQENSAHPIQFVCSDTFSLKYDFPSNKLPSISGRYDILIALKNALRDYAGLQATSEDAKEFNPSVAATRSTPEIMFKDILACMEIKSSQAETVQTPNNTLSQSSQPSDRSPFEGSSEEPSGLRGHVSVEDNQPKGSSRRERGLENDASSETRPRTGTGQSSDREKAGGEDANLLQLGHYAAEFLSRGPYVTHNIGIKVDWNKVQVCWFDRQNVISTSKFDILKDFPLFVAFITVFSRFSPSNWGIDQHFYPKEGFIQTALQGRGDSDLCIDLKLKPLCHRVALLGRGTMVLNGEMTIDGATTPVAVKTSYPQVNRLSERVFVSKGDQCKYKPFLPIIYHDEDVGFPTSQIRQRLKLTVNEETSRCRRIIISERLHSIDTLNADESLHVWYQCACIHREMWQKGCQHGDISVYNLMYRKELGTEGKIVGVLNDWDLSILCDSTGSPVTNGTFHFTGTIPFAALDLVADDSQPRKYRHDLESFIWTLLYLCLNHEASRRCLAPWHYSHTTASSRTDFVAVEAEKMRPREGFEDVYDFACQLMWWFMERVTGRIRLRAPQTQVTRPPLDPFSVTFSAVGAPKQACKWEELNEEQIWEEFCTVCATGIRT